MSTIAEHLRIIRKNLEELSDEHAEHAEHANEWLVITETEKTLDEVGMVFNQRITDKEKQNGY